MRDQLAGRGRHDVRQPAGEAHRRGEERAGERASGRGFSAPWQQQGY